MAAWGDEKKKSLICMWFLNFSYFLNRQVENHHRVNGDGANDGTQTDAPYWVCRRGEVSQTEMG